MSLLLEKLLRLKQQPLADEILYREEFDDFGEQEIVSGCSCIPGVKMAFLPCLSSLL